MPSISVVVPSYGRSELLARCIDSVATSIREQDEVVVVLRPTDTAAWRVAQSRRERSPNFGLRAVAVDRPGFWPALTTGIAAAERDIVAFLDDDAVPMPGWFDAISAGFDDPRIGGFGGRILNFDGVRTDNSFYSGSDVAVVDRLGVPRTRLHRWPASRVVTDVEFLPGSNMAFRRSLLRGLGELPLPAMAPGNELVIASSVRAQGFRVVFDSDVTVEHHPAPRPEHARADDDVYAYSYAYAMTVALSTRPVLARAFNRLVGSRVAPGALTLPGCALKGSSAFRRGCAALRGRRAARLHLKGTRVVRDR